MFVVMENHAYGQIIGSGAAPFENQLAGECGLATNYRGISHGSLRNYLALTSGSTQGITDESDPPAHQLNVPSIFSQLPGGGSRSLEESMPSSCYQANSGEYVVRHNPEAYYVNLGTDCSNYNVPLGSTPDLSAKFTLVTPNLIDDMHDGTIQQGDAWLHGFFQQLYQTPQWQAGTTAVFVTFDEDNGSSGNHVYTAAVAPSVVPGTRSGTAFSHYSLLRTAEDLLGLPPIGNAVSATGMESAFNLAATRAEIKMQLRGQLTPSGRGARSGTLLKRGGYTFLFRAPRAGRVVIKWYYRLSHGSRSSLILVAAGQATTSQPRLIKLTITLTPRGKQILRGSKTLKLTAKGAYSLGPRSAVTATKTFTLRR